MLIGVSDAHSLMSSLQPAILPLKATTCHHLRLKCIQNLSVMCSSRKPLEAATLTAACYILVVIIAAYMKLSKLPSDGHNEKTLMHSTFWSGASSIHGKQHCASRPKHSTLHNMRL